MGLGRLVVCGFLILCRKDFTTRAHVIMSITFIKAGDSERRKDLTEDAIGESLGGAAAGSLKSQNKRALETDSGVLLHTVLLVASPMGPPELKKIK